MSGKASFAFFFLVLGIFVNPENAQEVEDSTKTECEVARIQSEDNVLAQNILSQLQHHVPNRLSISDDPGTLIDEDNGYVQGIKSVKMNGKASAVCSEAGVLQIIIPLLWEELSGNYKWKSKGSILGGDHSFTIEKTTVTSHFSIVPINGAELALDTFDNLQFSKIEKKITGVGYLNWFASKLSNFYGNNITYGTWKKLLQPPIETAFKAAAKNVSLEFPNMDSKEENEVL